MERSLKLDFETDRTFPDRPVESVERTLKSDCEPDGTCPSNLVIPLSPAETHVMTLATTRKFTCLSVPNWYAMADCSTDGSIGTFYATLQNTENTSYVCSCETGEAGKCIHIATDRQIWSTDFEHYERDHQYAQES